MTTTAEILTAARQIWRFGVRLQVTEGNPCRLSVHRSDDVAWLRPYRVIEETTIDALLAKVKQCATPTSPT